jgi:hypothetical protein
MWLTAAAQMMSQASHAELSPSSAFGRRGKAENYAVAVGRRPARAARPGHYGIPPSLERQPTGRSRRTLLGSGRPAAGDASVKTRNLPQ